MTCRECENYEKCNNNKKIKIEINFGGATRLCNYVNQICKDYTPKRSDNNGE